MSRIAYAASKKDFIYDYDTNVFMTKMCEGAALNRIGGSYSEKKSWEANAGKVRRNLKAGRYIRVRRDSRKPNKREEFEFLKKFADYQVICSNIDLIDFENVTRALVAQNLLSYSRNLVEHKREEFELLKKFADYHFIKFCP